MLESLEVRREENAVIVSPRRHSAGLDAGSVKVVVEVVGIVVQCDKHQRVRCSFEAVHKGLLEGK